MPIAFTGFRPGENVELRRPSATPGLAPVAIETVAADSAGTATFAAAPVTGAHYQAVAASRRAWQLITGPPIIQPDYLPGSPGYSTCPPPNVADGLQPPIWTSAA